jgi:hypothetical protein
MIKKPDSDTPTPGELAAYLDGEATGEDYARVDAWLLENRDLSAELESLDEVTQLYQSAPTPEPTQEAWERVLTAIEARLMPCAHSSKFVEVRHRPPRRVIPKRSRLAWAAAVAAGLLIAFANFGGPSPRNVASQEPFPVASDDDVEILGVHGQDMALLVVGVMPLAEPLALATVQDVTVESVQPASDGMMPQIGVQTAESASPMIVAPMDGAATPEKTP